ncbi:hypothetical protein ACPOLB_10455 [Rubrivivax sp. RP6-9]|uniref:hypothetical protein n=1 Tax=Rubrivivax sp. RP6-9 TaxID=3415750 RepID=UPI003CC63730
MPTIRAFLPCSAALLLAALLCALPAGAQPAAPTDFELELWRSAQRYDTPAAYRAYLAAFPQGAFAAMAQAALDRPAAGGAPGGAPATTSGNTPAPATVARLQGTATSGSTALPVGTRLVGPGVVTVGAIGVRRQLLVPAGDWILLAAVDHRTPGTVQVSLATLALGQFSGRELRSLLLVDFNRRGVIIPGGSLQAQQAMGVLPRWPEAERCEAATGSELLLDVGSTRGVRHCTALRPETDWRRHLTAVPELPEALDSALATLGASTVPLPLPLRSELHITDTRYNHMGYTRLDAAAVGAPAARAEWLRRFAPLALQGYARDLEAEDLLPDQPGAAGIALPF